MSSTVVSDGQTISGGSLMILTVMTARVSCPGTPSVATASNVSVPSTLAALNAKLPRAASDGVTVDAVAEGCAPVDHVSGSPSSSLPITGTIVVVFLDAVTVCAATAGGVVPCSRLATCTSWVPLVAVSV